MNLRFFIARPVLSAVVSVVIVLMGLLALFSLPVEQYPDMAPPTIQVSTTYPGANAETVQKAVVVPLEEAINGVEDMNYITSTASNNGTATINIYFDQGTDPDMAAVNVQNRVATAQSLLPAEVVRVGVTTSKQQNAELKAFALYSPEGKYDLRFLNNYIKINVEPRIKRIPGVGNFMLLGSNYSMRIWLKPDRMAQYKLVPSDITAILDNQNIEAATGAFGENHDNTYQYTMKYRGRYSTPEEFGELVIRALPGGDVLRLKEVADIEFGDENYNYTSHVNELPGTICMVYQAAGSNASEVINEVNDVLDEISRTLPDGLEFVTLTDTNRFLHASIHEVVKTLLEAILLVILVVYVFLQDIRSTLIPTISIFVSIIGTFAFLSVAGFSINLLTLFALVLAIGTVVDDAIIVVEAVQTRFDAGYRSPFKAAGDAMDGISSAVLTSTLIFMAVFLPVSMMGGTSGEFYTQFGITMAVAVGISAVNAFTLSPALCALLLRPYKDEEGNTRDNFAARFRKAFNAVYGVMERRYTRWMLFFIRHRWLKWGTVAASIFLLALLMRTTKTGLIPDEDRSAIMINMNAKPGSSLQQTREMMDKVAEELKQIPEIEYRSDVTGFSLSGSGPSFGMCFLALKPWDERSGEGQTDKDVVNRIYGFAHKYPDIQMFAMTPPMIPGYGMGSGFELYLQDRAGGDLDDFKAMSDKFLAALNAREEIGIAFSTFQTDYPQYQVDIDAAQCEQAGITTGEVLETLSGYYGGAYVSNFNRFSKLYRVQIQAAPEYRVTPESMNHIYVRVGDGMSPLSQFVRLTKTYGPQDVSRFNLYNSIYISGTPAAGHSSGDALQAVKEVASQTLPGNYGYEFGGLSREESETGNHATITFGICLLLIYLVLCALYESFLVPFAILLSVPCGLMGSFVAANLFGLENNIYMQTGLIMLIGLLAKTAILITEYATRRRNVGLSLAQSVFWAARIRFRPILMTVLAMIFGLLPLMMSTGVGANGSRSLATGVVFGMLVGTVALLFLVPALFIVFRRLQERGTAAGHEAYSKP